MSWDWPHWRTTVKRALEDRGWTQGDLADRAGISVRSVNGYLADGARNPVGIPRGVIKLERPLGWKDGSTRAILGGGEPITQELQPTPMSAQEKVDAIAFICGGDFSDKQRISMIRGILAKPDKRPNF